MITFTLENIQDYQGKVLLTHNGSRITFTSIGAGAQLTLPGLAYEVRGSNKSVLYRPKAKGPLWIESITQAELVEWLNKIRIIKIVEK